MKRSPLTLDDVADWGNLLEAFRRASKGKRDRLEVVAMSRRLDFELEALRAAILSGAPTFGSLRRFLVFDPKRRTIHAPCFRDRVLHHALIAKVGPILDRGHVADVFACREGGGPHRCVARARRHLRRAPWYVKADIKSYFDSVDHGVLKAQLRRKFKDPGLLSLLDAVLDAYETAPGRGLPIGALTSQHFANAYLAPLDRRLLEGLKVRGMVRYMDDFVWWTETAEEARATLADVRAYLAEELRLRLKPEPSIQRSAAGLLICGFRVRADHILLSRRRRRRYVRARAKWESAYALGLIGASELQRGYDAALAITDGADAAAMRRADMARRPPPDA